MLKQYLGDDDNLRGFISFSLFIDYNIQQKRKKGMSQIFKSGVKCLLNSADSSEDYNRSTVKRLYSSVFSIIDNDQQVTDFNCEVQTSRIQKLLQNNIFVSHLQNKLRSEGLYDGYNLPIIRISVAYYQNYAHCPSYYEKAELDHQDMSNIFEKFGQVNKIILSNQKKDAYVFFNSFINAYISFKLLRNVKIRGGSLEIMMEWVNNNTDVHHQISSEVHVFINGINWESLFQSKKHKAEPTYVDESINTLKQNKFTCRYQIQIENERQFQVARRIIGSKGCNMKRILQDSITCNNENKNYSNDNANELLKLRLRGKGSGYKEGPEQQESNQSLHLCVSAKDEVVYNSACTRVEKLLTSIYIQFLEFSRRQGKSIQLSIKRINIGQFLGNQEVLSAQPNFQQKDSYEFNDQGYPNMMYRLSPQKISELLELRNKARRELNFNEADRIRNYLRSCGVCLIDEKGRRGRAAQVTTWKYMY